MLLLFLPSLLSRFTSVLLTLLVLGAANWIYVARSPQLYDFFFGKTGFVTVLQNTPNNFNDMLTTIFSASITYKATIVLLAILAGLLVYVLLEGFGHAVLGAADAWEDIQTADTRGKKAVEREVSVRLAVRCISLVSWLIYWLLFFQVLVPFCILTTRMTATELFSWSGGVRAIFGTALLLLGIHLHTVFMRLILLRPRLFGGDEVMRLEIEQDHP